MLTTSTDTRRRIVVESAQYLTHMLVKGHEPFPLTNPGHFEPGVYRGVIHLAEGTATITKEAS